MKIIRFSPPDVGEEEAKAMSEAVLSGWIIVDFGTGRIADHILARHFVTGG